jgi:enamine deaminase RidA (YjgF/YER057c/UK114 family)
MIRTIEERIAELGVTLPIPPKAVASYVAAVQTGTQLVTSGQLPLRDGALVATGLVGGEVSVEAAQEAAKWCAPNVLAQVRAATGDLEKIGRLARRPRL